VSSHNFLLCNHDPLHFFTGRNLRRRILPSLGGKRSPSQLLLMLLNSQLQGLEEHWQGKLLQKQREMQKKQNWRQQQQGKQQKQQQGKRLKLPGMNLHHLSLSQVKKQPLNLWLWQWLMPQNQFRQPPQQKGHCLQHLFPNINSFVQCVYLFSWQGTILRWWTWQETYTKEEGLGN